MHDVQRSSHEQRLMQRLAGIEGVQIPEVPDPSSLAQELDSGPLSVEGLLDTALHLAGTLAAIHERGVLHQNVNPEHVLMRAPQAPLLTGFHLATTFAEEQPGFTHHRKIRGNLAYLAPEQTGRTGRGVDSRADLYSLGATLYAASTARLPFEAVDPLQLLHDQLVRLPVPPHQLRGDLPPTFSHIVMRLLEKEPERRYQSARGLAHDLSRLRDAFLRGEAPAHVLGEHDFPLRLTAPARLVGRKEEIATLQRALEDAIHGRARVVLVAGAPGVGKTSLINELRHMVTTRRGNGFLASGKFDQYRRDAQAGAAKTFRALGRLLLAEPEGELTAQRERILQSMGANAGLVCTLPEFALLLGPQPDVPQADPALAEARLHATAVNLLRAIVSPLRPLVMVLDDLQWSGAFSARFMEAVMDAPDLAGLLLVGSYREAEVDAAHPLAAMASRTNAQGEPPVHIALHNLAPDALQELLAEMMRLPSGDAADLARIVGEHTGGNPYDTVELLNALRRDDALRRAPAGWQWDEATLRRYVGQSGVLDLLAARIGRLPESSQTLLHALACLGGQVSRGLLGAATGSSAPELERQLAPPLEDGLLVSGSAEDTSVRMRHDRVQQATYASMEPAQRRGLHLDLARRLAAVPEYRAAAVQQYLACAPDIVEPAECRVVARLLHGSVAAARSAANHVATHQLAAAALALVSRVAQAEAHDDALLRDAIEVDLHVALCSLGRFEEADSLYRTINDRHTPVEDWVDAACAQLAGLVSRSRPGEAVMLGLQLLRQLGRAVPDDFAAANLEQRLTQLGEWSMRIDLAQDRRPYTGDGRITATVRVMNRICYSAFFHDLRIVAWVVLEAQMLWEQYGPSPDLVLPLAGMGSVTVGLNKDYRSAYHGSRHVIGVSEARGWDATTAEARYLLAVHATHWVEPLELTVRHLQVAREGMLRNGLLHAVCYAYRASTTAMLDCSPTLQGLASEVDSGLAIALRLRHDYGTAMMLIEKRLLRQLRDEPDTTTQAEHEADGAIERQTKQPAVNLSICFCKAFAAALFGDMPQLVVHASEAMKHVPAVSNYRGAQVRLLHTLALAHRLRSESNEPHADDLQRQLDQGCEWLARRAEDAPPNFLHLCEWMQAERAWALRDWPSAARAFDNALCRVEALTRPWHHALIAERAGLFHLEQGLKKSGAHFIAQARDAYRAWGATAKVRRLEEAHGLADRVAANVRTVNADDSDAVPRDAAVDSIDTLAILRASQALSSETSIARLEARVAEVLESLTGATAVRFALWDEDLKDWLISHQDKGSAAPANRITAHEAGARGLLPLVAFRYAERTREPLLIGDAITDDRFSRDPYFLGAAHCSLLVVPIMNKGNLRAMLLLENRLSRDAFSAARLDAVSLIAGQLAVSLENALLYDRLEQHVQDQTRELMATARRAGMAQIATNVLHNVGNVLTSVNVSTHMLASHVRESRASRLADVAGLLEARAGDLQRFFADDEKGRMLPRYLRELSDSLANEREQVLAELGRVLASVEHIKNVVAMQQSYAGSSRLLETHSIADLVEEVLGMQQQALDRDGISVVRDYSQAQSVAMDKTRVMQILVNLVDNAREAMADAPGPRSLAVAIEQVPDWLRLRVRDTGCGIAAEHLPKIFSHGFTTKEQGHGFGLHSCAVAAMEMGGTLAVHSDGAGAGATFTLELGLETP